MLLRLAWTWSINWSASGRYGMFVKMEMETRYGVRQYQTMEKEEVLVEIVKLVV